MFLPSGRFAYARGFKSQAAAYEAFLDMLNAGEISNAEGEIERYTLNTREGQAATRWAVTIPA